MHKAKDVIPNIFCVGEMGLFFSTERETTTTHTNWVGNETIKNVWLEVCLLIGMVFSLQNEKSKQRHVQT